VKLTSRLLILTVLPMLLLVACGQESPAPQATTTAPQPTDAEQAQRQAQSAAADMRQGINRLVTENQMLTRELHDLQRRVMDQSSQLQELSQSASRLEAAATARISMAARDDVAAAPEPRPERTAGGIGSFLLFLVFLIVALIVIYFIYRALKPRPFEDDEDDDFSSFDDDFGFDDEEEDDDLGDDADKKKDDENK